MSSVRRKSFLSRASSQLSFRSVKSRFSSLSGGSKKRRPSIHEIQVTVDQVKPHVFRAIEDDPHLFHPKDVEKLRNADTFIQRFINEHQNWKKNNWEEIVDLVIESLKWRKDFGINDLNRKMFPREFYDLKVFVYGQIGPKDLMVYVKARRFRKIEGASERILQFGVWCFESLAEEYGDHLKWSAFSDLSGCGLSQVDFPLFMKAIPILLKNFPDIAEHGYIYELPWILKPIAKVVMACLPAKYNDMVTFCSKSDFLEKVPKDKLPDFLGGPVKTREFEPCEDCVTLEEAAAELGMTSEQIKKTRKVVNEMIADVRREEEKSRKKV